MKLAVIIKIQEITGMRISTAQHYRIPDIKGRFSFYCVCCMVKERRRKNQVRRYGVRKIKQILSGKERVYTVQRYAEAGDTMLSDLFDASDGPSCIVSPLLNWHPL